MDVNGHELVFVCPVSVFFLQANKTYRIKLAEQATFKNCGKFIERFYTLNLLACFVLLDRNRLSNINQQTVLSVNYRNGVLARCKVYNLAFEENFKVCIASQ